MANWHFGKYALLEVDGVTSDELSDALDHPNAQITDALSFMQERGCVRVVFGRVMPASTFLLEDAMCEFHALDLARWG